MTHPNKRKGQGFERDTRAQLETRGYKVVKPHEGGEDEGDFYVPALDATLECKNEKRMNLPGAVDEAECEAKVAKTSRFAAVVKRRGKNAGKAYVVIPLDHFLDEWARPV